MRPSSYEVRVVVTLQAHVDGPHPEEAVVNAAVQAIENAVRQGEDNGFSHVLSEDVTFKVVGVAAG